ncbi:hypothetical protein [Celeribacter arenosi]|uniref:Uncharacterized protein n=1 Tax=Celeribacter arenosi TaxID=792649 RepID=A0ABP7KD53_9RHOB
MGFPRDYAKAMEKQFGYQVVWPPTAPLKLGDFGIVKRSKSPDGYAFDRMGNITDKFKIKFKTLSGAKAGVEKLESAGVSITKASGGGAKDGIEVEVSVGFEKKNSMVYHGSDMTILTIDDMLGVGKKLGALLKKGSWDKKWVVVTSVHETRGLTVLLSGAKKTTLGLGGTAELLPGNLAKASAKAQVTAQNASVATYLSTGICTPLLQARVVRKKGFRAFSTEEDPNALVSVQDTDVLALDDDDEFAPVTFNYCDIEAGADEVLSITD